MSVGGYEATSPYRQGRPFGGGDAAYKNEPRLQRCFCLVRTVGGGVAQATMTARRCA